MKALRYVTLVVIVVLCFTLASCVNVDDDASNPTSDGTNISDIQQDNSNTNLDKTNENQEESEMELNEVYNYWVGNYSTVENYDINGTLILKVEEGNFCYANIDVDCNEGKLKARLFVAVEDEILVLSLVSYEDGSTIDKFQEGDVVLRLKDEEGTVKTMINLNDHLGDWLDLFVK